MERQELEQTLTRLHEELAAAGTVDPELRSHLETLLADIRSVLEGAGAAGGDDDESLVDRSREALDRFEADHPKLTVILGRLADMLARMGI